MIIFFSQELYGQKESELAVEIINIIVPNIKTAPAGTSKLVHKNFNRLNFFNQTRLTSDNGIDIRFIPFPDSSVTSPAMAFKMILPGSVSNSIHLLAVVTTPSTLMDSLSRAWEGRSSVFTTVVTYDRQLKKVNKIKVVNAANFLFIISSWFLVFSGGFAD
jgi:hypothetical protein